MTDNSWKGVCAHCEQPISRVPHADLWIHDNGWYACHRGGASAHAEQG